MTTNVQPLSKTVKKAVKQNTSPGRPVAPAAKGLFNICAFLLVIAACAAGLLFLWRNALEDARFRFDGETLGMGGSVRECPEAVEDLRRIGLAFNGRSLLDPKLIGDMEEAYGKSRWVRKVTRLRRSFPNRIDVEFLLRVPVAQVRCDQRWWMIDLDGVLLPVEGVSTPFPRLPEIVGVTARVIGHRPAPGLVWSDEGVSGALGVMKAFWASSLADVLPVQRVVVNTGVFKAQDGAARELRRRFEVVSSGSVVVRWGTYSELGGGEELGSAEKLVNLHELLSREEALRPGVSFDVRTKLPGYSL